MLEQSYRVAATTLAQKYFQDNSLTYTISELIAKSEEIYDYIFNGTII
jgi:hypothetical protein